MASAGERTLPSEGEIVAGKYQVVRLLGQGGMGAVFEAQHLKLKQPVALKLLLPEIADRADLVERFEREARAAAQLKSRHAVRVMDVDVTDQGLPYMVMEFLSGRDLATELGERATLPVIQAVDYLLQACTAIEEAHGLGIIHRDLKPANLFLATQDGERVLKVLDFGISKLQSEEAQSVTMTQAVMGTPLYMSPEQLRSSKAVDARADIWSLGVILYELLTGRTPFEGESATSLAVAVVTETPRAISSFRADVPAALEAVVLKALQKTRDDRYDSVRSYRAALAPFGSAVPSSRRPQSSTAAMLGVAATQPSVSPAAVAQSTGLTFSRSKTGSPVNRTAAALAALGVAAVLAIVLLVTRSEPEPSTAVSSPAAAPVNTVAERAAHPEPRPIPAVASAPAAPALPAPVSIENLAPEVAPRASSPAHSKPQPPAAKASAAPQASPMTSPPSKPKPPSELPARL